MARKLFTSEQDLVEYLFEQCNPDDASFNAMRNILPDVSWAKKDLAAVRLGWEMHKLSTTPAHEAKIADGRLMNLAKGYEPIPGYELVQAMALELLGRRVHYTPSIIIIT